MFKVGEIVKYAPNWCGKGEEYYIHEILEVYPNEEQCKIITLNTMLTLKPTEIVDFAMIQKAKKYEILVHYKDLEQKYFITNTEDRTTFCGYDFMGSVNWYDDDIERSVFMDLDEAEQIVKDLESSDEDCEPEQEQGIDQAELDDCLDRINDLAWEIINKKDLQWVYPTEPIYPLKWYICYGKAPVEFIKAVMNFGKWTLANILVTWRDNDTMDIVRKIERRIL